MQSGGPTMRKDWNALIMPELWSYQPGWSQHIITRLSYFAHMADKVTCQGKRLLNLPTIFNVLKGPGLTRKHKVYCNLPPP